ncbi:helix-turn-helix transcriptional regulator [Nonomuraea longicatena]|uniref:HTH cro/C1-type domain-containing protein n=1 Tax=Nonomuraea longicatena TaxID=83682 RepID=A0ABP4ADH3_9ACTN
MNVSSQPASAGEVRGHLLRRAREVRGWSQSEMARRLREAGTGRYAVNTRRDGIWYWEHGRIPDKPTQILIADILGIPVETVDERPWPEWLSEDPIQRPAPRPWTLLGAAQSLNEVAGGAVDVTRRELALISGGALTASLFAWITADPVAAGQITTGQRIGDGALSRLEERARVLRRMDDADGGGIILSETASALALATGLLRDRRYSNAHGSRLYAVASDLARQRAAALFDVRGECADGAFETALRAAHIAGDNALGANCLAFWTVSAYNSGRLHDAESMATAALAAVRGRTTPRIEAMLTSRRARARAHLNDHRCWADFDRAEELLAQADGHDDPDWVYWFDQAELLGARASSLRDMGQPKPAETTFAQAQALFAPSWLRTRALYLTRQADVQFAQGHIEQACATAGEALELTEAISSHRSIAPLLDLAGRLDAYAVPEARGFCERVRTVLAA